MFPYPGYSNHSMDYEGEWIGSYVDQNGYQERGNEHLVFQNHIRNYHEQIQRQRMMSTNEADYWMAQDPQPIFSFPNNFQPIPYQPTINPHPQQPIPPPPTNHPDPYTHYLYLTSLKKTHPYTTSSQVPSTLIRYLLDYISLQNCPFMKTALSYIVTNMRDFTEILAAHQVEHLGQIVRRRYPGDVQYQREYGKLVLMDQGQGEKMVELLEILCVLFCQLQGWRIRNNRNQMVTISQQAAGSQYLCWVLNYTMVLFKHIDHLKQDSDKQGVKERISKWEECLQNNKKQLIGLLDQVKIKDKSIVQKISKIICKSLPSNTILQTPTNTPHPPPQSNLLHQYISLFLSICHQLNFDGPSVLCQHVREFFIQELRNFSGGIGRILGRVGEDQGVWRFYCGYSCKLLNVLGFGIWNKYQRLQLIQILTSCQFLCQQTQIPTQTLTQAFHPPKTNPQKHHHHYHQNPQQNQLTLDEAW